MQITIDLDEELLKNILDAAKYQSLPLSEMFRIMAEWYLNDYKRMISEVNDTNNITAGIAMPFTSHKEAAQNWGSYPTDTTIINFPNTESQK